MKAARSNALAFRALFYFNKIDYTCGDGCCLVEADGRMTDISPDIVDRYKEGCVFKSLWSGSGRDCVGAVMALRKCFRLV